MGRERDGIRVKSGVGNGGESTENISLQMANVHRPPVRGDNSASTI